MIFVFILFAPVIYALSILPFFLLHGLSDFLYLLVYRGLGYRVQVVRENLRMAFPEKSDEERLEIERKFYHNLCDLIVESIKTFTISERSLRERCVFKTPELAEELWAQKSSVTGICSHMANWEWVVVSAGMVFKHCALGVYKPLSNRFFDRMVARSRERFGTVLTSIKNLRIMLKEHSKGPVMVGLISDQAPHHYSSAFQVPFLNQLTYVFPGPGVITVQNGFVPVWGWMTRVGRSRYEFGIEKLDFGLMPVKSDFDREQIARISQQHHLSMEESEKAYSLTIAFTKKLEEKIKMAPQDWLWSHRRWKNR